MTIFLDIFEHLSDVSLWAADETGKRLESANYYSWSPIGSPTVIEHNACHEGLNIIGATEIMNHFKLIVNAYPVRAKKYPDDKVDNSIRADHIIKFLKELIDYDRQRGIAKTFVILDNARIHTAESVKDFAKEHESDLYLLFQPKYSPELNPQENIWNWMKNFLSKANAYRSIDELKENVSKFKEYISNNFSKVKQRVYARLYYK
jgi:transposase